MTGAKWGTGGDGGVGEKGCDLCFFVLFSLLRAKDFAGCFIFLFSASFFSFSNLNRYEAYGLVFVLFIHLL